MRKLCSLFLFFCILSHALLVCAATAPYNAIAKTSGAITEEAVQGAKAIGRLYAGDTVLVYSFDPYWAEVSYNGVRGFVPRTYLERGRAVTATTPPYGVELYRYVATVGASGACLYTAKDPSSTVLLVLGEGARITLIGVEDGWGYLAYYRQYAYVRMDSFSELLPVYDEVSLGDSEAPIAAFTSYYVPGSDDTSVKGKEINIEVNCSYMNGDVVRSGGSIDYNNHYGPFYPSKGYVKGPVLISTGWGLGNGGGVCQVSSTLYNVLLQLPGITITTRRSHGPSGIAYLPIDMDAAVGTKTINFCFRNDYPFDIRFEASAKDGALYIAVYRVTDEN